MKEAAHIVVDMLYDFIDGSLACKGAEEAVVESVNFINQHPLQKVFYVCDCHPSDHCSFKDNGGIWPVHCVEGTRGGSIHTDYYEKVTLESNRPNPDNIFYKGRDRQKEQYSGFESEDEKGVELNSRIPHNIIVTGIASEYCIRETVLALLRSGHKVSILKSGIGYVDYQAHLNNIEELTQMGIDLIV